MEETKTEKLSYYQRNKEKILAKRRMEREEKRRLLFNKQLENIMLDDMPKLVIPCVDPVVEQFAERVVEPVVAEFAERTDDNFVVSMIEPVIEPLEPVDKKRKTKKTKTI